MVSLQTTPLIAVLVHTRRAASTRSAAGVAGRKWC